MWWWWVTCGGGSRVCWLSFAQCFVAWKTFLSLDHLTSVAVASSSLLVGGFSCVFILWVSCVTTHCCYGSKRCGLRSLCACFIMICAAVTLMDWGLDLGPLDDLSLMLVRFQADDALRGVDSIPCVHSSLVRLRFVRLSSCSDGA